MTVPATSFPPQRLLIRGVNWLGDAVMTTPALLRLREGFPGAHLSLLTPEKLADLWQHHPAVDAILSFGAQESVWRIARQLRREAFEVGLIFPNSPRSALELWLARVPRRIGYAAAWRRGLLTDPLPARPGHVPMRKCSRREIQRRLTGGVTSPAAPDVPSLAVGRAHHIYQYLHLVSALGANPAPVAPRLWVTAGEVDTVAQRFGFGPNLTDGPMVLGLNAGAEYGPAKRWPRERFVAAAVEIQRRTGCRWLLLGGPGDTALAASLANEILAAAKSGARGDRPVSPDGWVLNLAGRTSLRELCAVLKACRVVLTNDSGPMHVAAAVGTPVVVPFGSTSPALTGPGLPGDPRHHLLQSGVPCSPCFLRECPIDFRCMRDLTVARVVEAVLESVAATE